MRKPAAHAARQSGSSTARRQAVGRTPAACDPAMTRGSRIGYGLRPRRRPVLRTGRLKSGAPFAWGSASAADAQTLDEGLIARLILLLDVVEKRSPLRHHLEEAPAGMVVLDVRFEVAGQVGDALGENRNLHFGRPGVADFQTILIDERRLALSGDRHRLFLKVGRKTAHSISGRTGTASRSVATLIPRASLPADRALIQISRLGASKMLGWAMPPRTCWRPYRS